MALAVGCLHDCYAVQLVHHVQSLSAQRIVSLHLAAVGGLCGCGVLYCRWCHCAWVLCVEGVCDVVVFCILVIGVGAVCEYVGEACDVSSVSRDCAWLVCTFVCQ